MYPGAHSRKDSKPRFPTNKAAVLLLSMILLIGIAVGTTVAFLVARTEPMKSTFEYAKVSCEVTGSKENVQIKNTGNTAAYIRATYVVTWRDAYGKVAVSVPGGYSYTLTENLGNYWNKGADGYFYYSLPVSPGVQQKSVLWTVRLHTRKIRNIRFPLKFWQKLSRANPPKPFSRHGVRLSSMAS